MKALIVDDDKFVIAALLNGIDWYSIGFAQPFTAYNITDAKKIIETEAVDLLLSDIDMPNGSGLDLLTWIRDQGNDMNVIFLTNYADFTYAQKALELKSFHYFLKPIEYDKLTSVIKDATKKIQSQTNTLDKVCERFWYSYLFESAWDNINDLEGYLRSMKLPYTTKDFFVPIIIDYYPYNLGPDHKLNHYFASEHVQSQFIHTTFDSIFSELSDMKYTLLEYKTTSSRYIAIFHLSSDELPPYLLMSCERFISTVYRQTNQNINLFVGVPSMFQSFMSSFYSLRNMMTNCLDCKCETILLSKYVPSEEDYIPLDNNPLELYLKNEQYQAFLDFCRQYLDKLSHSNNLHALSLNNFQVDISQIIYSFLKEKNILAHKLLQGDTYHILAANARNSVYDMQLYLQYVIELAKEHLDFSVSEESVAQSMKKYVDLHYAEDIGRASLSDILFLDPDYASKLFKKETGMSFGSYIIKKRISVAQDLLLTTDLPINVISDNIGYDNYSYFIRLFKKMTQMTPIEYRNNHGAT